MLQALGRRYVGHFNARHQRSGTLWDGRFRCAAVEPGEWLLLALAFVERGATGEHGESSREHHLGAVTWPWISDPPAYWALGNTPFERHAVWRARLEQELGPAQMLAVEQALRSGIPLGGESWLLEVQALTALPLRPRKRGRPLRNHAASAEALVRQSGRRPVQSPEDR
jgi:putative transposase